MKQLGNISNAIILLDEIILASDIETNPPKGQRSTMRKFNLKDAKEKAIAARNLLSLFYEANEG